MAKISATTEEKVFSISQWLGLHESPDGDTKLKMGEAAAMRNWTITRDGNLHRRPGTKTITELADAPVKRLWSGNVMGEDVLLAACGGHLWSLHEEDGEWSADDCGELNTDDSVYIFPFAKKAYILNGHEYLEFDGEAIRPVEGYRPLVAITITPDGGMELLEEVNKLTAKRRVWLSPDGEKNEFPFPEKNLASVDYIIDTTTGQPIYDRTIIDLMSGTIEFENAPARGVNTIEVGYIASTDYRDHVTKMRYAELFDGEQDTRVFLYGDGSNECLYSDIDYNGDPRADYFPDLNVARVGDANTPITGMIRHYGTLVCYKSNSSWAISASSLTLADTLQTRAFYITPLNRTIGNEAMGQQQLVLNSPRTLHGADIYEWRNNASYSSNLSKDERQAKRMSDRVYATMKTFNVPECICYDDNYNQEYYVCCDGKALVQNYAADAWYYYDNFPVTAMVSHKNELYIGTPDGKVKHFGYEHRSDDAAPVESYWESGSMSFGADYKRKYSAQMWVGIKPESGSRVTVTVQTDRKSEYAEKEVVTELATFENADFADFSFNINRKPQMKKLKIKAKKFVFYKLIFEGETSGKTATVLAVDIKVRYTGNAK